MPALVIPIIGDASKLASGLGGAKGQISAFGKSMDVTTLAMGAGIAGAAVIAGKALLDMGAAAAQDHLETDQLTKAIEQATGSTADHTAEVDAAIAAGQEKAFTDTQTRKALTSLVTATGSVSKATALLTTAQDVARFAGVDLATAADAVAKADRGQDGALRKMLPGIAKGKTGMDTLANATKAAAGQADIYAKSGPGMADKTSDSLGELGETVGEAVLPIMDALVPVLIEIVRAFSVLVKAILPALIPLLRIVGAVLATVARAAATLIGFLAQIITKVLTALRVIGDLLNKIPKIDLPFGLGSIGGGGGKAAPGGGGAAPGATGLAAGGVGRAAAAGGIHITIQGAIDPEATARQIRRILDGHAARSGAGVGI